MRAKVLSVIAVAVCIMFTAPAAEALDGYSTQDQKTFMDWCTLEQTNSDSLCSCALKSVARTVPASALVSYIASATSGESLSLSSLATSSASSTAIAVTQALSTCSG